VCILTAPFFLAEFGPREQSEAEIDGGRVERIEARIEVHAERVVSIKRPRNADQLLREVGEDAPVVRLVGVGQRGTRHAPTKAHVVQFAPDRSQARFDVAQALAVGQLGERHRKILVPAGEAAMVRVAPITCNALLKLIPGQVIHDLRENGLSCIHPRLSKADHGSPTDRQGSPQPIQIEKSKVRPIPLIMMKMQTLNRI